MNVKDNIPSLFILLVNHQVSQESLTGLISLIQDIDFTARVAVIYQNKMNVEKLYKNTKLFNIYIYIPYATLPRYWPSAFSYKYSYGMFEICRFCNNGENKIQHINTWEYDKGFRYQLEIPKSFKNNFYGKELRMGADFYLPHINAENYIYIGDVLNATWKFIAATDGSSGLLWSFEAFVHDLNKGYIDAIGSGWKLLYDRYLLLDVSAQEFFLWWLYNNFNRAS